MTDTAVRCRDLRINLGGKDVVDGIDLDVTPGDWVAVVGPNGAGKTTLMHALAGLIPSTGELTVGDSTHAVRAARPCPPSSR
ncbi:hypothetical protein GCM10020255_030540 [Rhodococcus baikonurensis]